MNTNTASSCKLQAVSEYKYSFKLQAISCKRIQIQLQAASHKLQVNTNTGESLKPKAERQKQNTT
ncbi:hypothetical protein A4R26_03720 [Niastella populi]|uniref:Uncharacterized protein n=1 Tax=Niastella populi TaxID=550983 RepID=A0A1V9FJM1_9BACT|nr:hypothetical protein A4R26_03720 [Niastella populi]